MSEIAAAKGEYPDRQSLRLRRWNYSAGWYFVTINTQGGRALFGMIADGRVILNDLGRLAEACWLDIPLHFPEARLDEFVIMPNHIHGLVQLVPNTAAHEAHTLGDVVGAYKAAVSRIFGRRGGQLPTRPGQLPTRPGQFPTRPDAEQLPARPIAIGASAIWHRNYWDVIVRDEKAMINIRRYIRDNPANYEVVTGSRKPRTIGNQALFDAPKMGFLASRGKNHLPDRLPLQAGEVVISGFLSPMERVVFNSCLHQNTPVIWVTPFGLDAVARSPTVQRAIDDGQLLLISPFDNAFNAPRLRRAAWCNDYVLAHCNRLVVGHLNPDGMLACILSEANPERAIIWLKEKKDRSSDC